MINFVFWGNEGATTQPR